jgi:excisionase family DNA binding protein
MTIPDEILTATASMLKPYTPGITPSKLQGLLTDQEELDSEKVTRQQAADIIGVSRPTIDRYVKAGKLEKIKYSQAGQGHVKFLLSDIKEFARKGVITK